MENHRIFGLDLLRVKAVGLVLFAQCLWIFPQLNALIAQAASVFHFIGIEVLLVLSGFLLYLKLFPLYVNGQLDRDGLVQVIRRKLSLTLPLYYLAVLLSLLMARVYWNHFPSDIWRYFTLVNGLVDAPDVLLPESWAIMVLLWGSLLLPTFLWGFDCLLKPKNKSLFFIGTTILLLMGSFFARTIYSHTQQVSDIRVWDDAIKSVVIYRLDSVFIGVLAGWLLQRFAVFSPFKKVFLLMGFLGVLFLFAGVGFFQLLIENHPLFWNVFYLPLTSIIIACFLPILYDWRSVKPTLGKPVAFASRISYGIYLLHFTVILQFLQMRFNSFETTAAAAVFVGLYVFVTIVVSTLIWFLFQKRFLANHN